MAAPSKTSRVTPSGSPMKDGYRSLVTLSNIPALTLWEKTVTFAGRDGGDPIPYSNMHNVTWHTQRPRSLKKGTDLSMRCAYSGMTFADLDAQVNLEQTISQFFPSGNWCAFYGFLRSAILQENQEGSQPEVQVVIAVTNWDPSNNVEAGPAYGTGT
jgi:hypothetical protein